MPSSSSKKKKAAKRKKKRASSNTRSSSTNSQPQGDNLNTKETISGDITSKTPGDKSHDQLMEEEKRDSTSSYTVGLSTSDNKPMLGGSENGGENHPSQEPEKVVEVMGVVRELKTVGGESESGGENHPSREPEEVVEVMDFDRELKTVGGESESAHVCIEFVKSAKESGNGGSSSSSDSNSDEESHLVHKNPSSMMEESGEIKEEAGVGNSVAGIVPPVDSVAEIVPPVDPVDKIVSSVDELETQVVVVTKSEKIEDSSSIDGNTLPSSDVPTGNTSVSGDHQKESETIESLQKQEREELAIVPATVQPTSWKSCCGLFDLLMGSNR